MLLYIRKLYHTITAILHIGCGSCERCGLRWHRKHGVDYHITPGDTSGGCFVLCQQCWDELTPVTRLPFYQKVCLREWPTCDDWPGIRANVLKGL